MDASELCRKLADVGMEMMDTIRRDNLAPEMRKNEPRYSMAEAAALIGRTPKSIKRVEKEIGEPQREQRGKAQHRVYSLTDIHQYQDHFGTGLKRPPGSRGQVISVINYKGGVAKTTHTLHLGHYFAQRGARTLMVDSDPQASLTYLATGIVPDDNKEGIDSEQTLSSMYYGDVFEIDSVRHIMPTNFDRLDIVPANLELNAAALDPFLSRDAARREDWQYVLMQAINTVRDQYDLILIDSPPTISGLTMNAMVSTDGMLVPIPPSVLDMASTTSFFSMMGDIFDNLDHRLQWLRCVLSRVPQQERIEVSTSAKPDLQGKKPAIISRQIAQVIRARLGGYVLNSEVLESAAVQRCTMRGESLFESATHDKTWQRATEGFVGMCQEVEALIVAHWAEQERELRYGG